MVTHDSITIQLQTSGRKPPGPHSSDAFAHDASSIRKKPLATGWPWPFSTITQCAFAALGGAAPTTSNFVHSVADSEALHAGLHSRPASVPWASCHSMDS